MKNRAAIRLRRWVLGGLLLLGLTTVEPACAQPAAAGGTIQQQTKPFYVEGAVVVVLLGAAVFVVCRGSRR